MRNFLVFYTLILCLIALVSAQGLAQQPDEVGDKVFPYGHHPVKILVYREVQIVRDSQIVRETRVLPIHRVPMLQAGDIVEIEVDPKRSAYTRDDFRIGWVAYSKTLGVPGGKSAYDSFVINESTNRVYKKSIRLRKDFTDFAIVFLNTQTTDAWQGAIERLESEFHSISAQDSALIKGADTATSLIAFLDGLASARLRKETRRDRLAVMSREFGLVGDNLESFESLEDPRQIKDFLEELKLETTSSKVSLTARGVGSAFGQVFDENTQGWMGLGVYVAKLVYGKTGYKEIVHGRLGTLRPICDEHGRDLIDRFGEYEIRTSTEMLYTREGTASAPADKSLAYVTIPNIEDRVGPRGHKRLGHLSFSISKDRVPWLVPEGLPESSSADYIECVAGNELRTLPAPFLQTDYVEKSWQIATKIEGQAWNWNSPLSARTLKSGEIEISGLQSYWERGIPSVDIVLAGRFGFDDMSTDILRVYRRTEKPTFREFHRASTRQPLIIGRAKTELNYLLPVGTVVSSVSLDGKEELVTVNAERFREFPGHPYKLKRLESGSLLTLEIDAEKLPFGKHELMVSSDRSGDFPLFRVQTIVSELEQAKVIVPWSGTKVELDLSGVVDPNISEITSISFSGHTFEARGSGVFEADSDLSTFPKLNTSRRAETTVVTGGVTTAGPKLEFIELEADEVSVEIESVDKVEGSVYRTVGLRDSKLIPADSTMFATVAPKDRPWKGQAPIATLFLSANSQRTQLHAIHGDRYGIELEESVLLPRDSFGWLGMELSTQPEKLGFRVKSKIETEWKVVPVPRVSSLSQEGQTFTLRFDPASLPSGTDLVRIYKTIQDNPKGGDLRLKRDLNDPAVVRFEAKEFDLSSFRLISEMGSEKIVLRYEMINKPETSTPDHSREAFRKLLTPVSELDLRHGERSQ